MIALLLKLQSGNERAFFLAIKIAPKTDVEGRIVKQGVAGEADSVMTEFVFARLNSLF